jgi:hypothetical protein
MSDDEVMFLTSAILLSQTLGSAIREVRPGEIELAVTNAERLREEIVSRRRRQSQQYGTQEPAPGK